MTWHVLHLNDVAPTPWRNGGGTTRELAVWPETQNWVWRMSVAEVAQGGPFSAFPGVHRWFSVLSGAGVQLTIENRRHVLHDDTAPFDFDGDVPVDCQLLDDPTQDFNLMVKQGVGARMERLRVPFDRTLNTPKTIAVYAGNTGARVLFNTEVLTLEPQTLIWQHLPVGSQFQVHAEHALWMEIDL
ncbi:HutD family protein [Rhodoferax sp. PAMC 29310]|uniref:HutD/Ves family protein n=1 Tax=Rhodoferax sp. PAMC 29310 TaxID=2822760 RepID=UPI001B322298|nr:HutD family protein [Rhodoferax sp. PAMC 29310]